MTKQKHSLEKICTTCIQTDMAFQRHFKKYNYCIAHHQGKYKTRACTQFVINGYGFFAYICKYKEKGK